MNNPAATPFYFNERMIKVIGITLVFLMNVLSGYMFETGGVATFLLKFLTVLFVMIAQWEFAHYIIRQLRKRLPLLAAAKKRTLYNVLALFGISVAMQFVGDLLVDKVIDHKPLDLSFSHLATIFLSALLFAFTTTGLFEAVYYFTHFSRAEREKEELLRANLQSRFDSLKGQVSPHFLFNSLSTLSSLIAKDAVKAEHFVEHLSNVYRFLLRSNEQPLIPLKEELEFIESYAHLLATRFGENFSITLQIDEPYLAYLIPPLTLQLLVENAVKHNTISKEQPLQIRLFTTASDRLHVVNNLQRKRSSVASANVGLGNIIGKYRLLKCPDVEIKESAAEFIVIVPLIKADTYAGLHY
ncbi:MAG TPA: histidine kinase [Chitinophagaceae bacterium]|nr:histidine kinase [Chitinophagaceae bacterium]